MTSQLRTEYDYYPNDPAHAFSRKVEVSRVKDGPLSAPSLETTTTYDVYGNPTNVTIYGSGEAQPRTITYAYSPDRYFVRSTTNGLGHSVTNTFDSRNGNILTSVDANGLTTTHTYDVFGRPIQETRPGLPPVEHRIFDCGGAHGLTCPPNAAYQKTTEASGQATVRTFFDVLDREIGHHRTAFGSSAEVAVSRTFTARGEVESESEPGFAGSSAPRVYFEDFDALGRPARKIVERPGINSPFDEVTVAYAYEGRTTTVNLPDGTSVAKTYDMEGRVVSSVDQNQSETTYAYDRHGELEFIVDASGNVQAFVRDASGRVVQTRTPNRATETVVYNGFGEPKETVTANGHTITFDYDTMGRVLERSVDGNLESRFGYDVQFKGAMDYERGGSDGPTGFCQGYAYDALGRTSKTATFVDGARYETVFKYDANHGWLAGKQYPSGEVVEYRRSPTTGESTAVQSPGASVPYRAVIARDARGHATHERFANGLTGDYRYLASTGEVELLRVYPTGGDVSASVQHLTYVYENAYAQLSTRTNHIAGVEEEFDYDLSRRLKRSTRRWSTGAETRVDYQFDDLGNVRLKSDYGTNYAYGEAGRGNAAQAGPHALLSYEDLGGNVVSDFRYDDAGNLLEGDGRTTHYDAFDRVLQLTNGADQTDFAYGPSGQRYRRRDGGTTTLTIGGDYEIEDPFGAWLARHYLGGVLVTRTSQGVREVYYQHESRLGSTDVVTDDVGAAVGRYAFGPFGAPRDDQWQTTWSMNGGTPSPLTHRGFTGHEQVDGNFVTHMGGRVYDYGLGRFLGEDPMIADVADAQTLNGYSYVSNDPMSFTDPTGFVEVSLSKQQDVLTGLMDKAPDKVSYHEMGDGGVTVQMETGDTVVTAARDEAGNFVVKIASKEDAGGPSALAVAENLYQQLKDYGQELSARMDSKAQAAAGTVDKVTENAAASQLTEMVVGAVLSNFTLDGLQHNAIGVVTLPEQLFNAASGDIGENIAMAEIAYKEGNIVAAGDHASKALGQASTVLMIVAGGAAR